MPTLLVSEFNNTVDYSLMHSAQINIQSIWVTIFQKAVDDVKVAIKYSNTQRWNVKGVSSSSKCQQFVQLVFSITQQCLSNLMIDT